MCNGCWTFIELPHSQKIIACESRCLLLLEENVDNLELRGYFKQYGDCVCSPFIKTWFCHQTISRKNSLNFEVILKLVNQHGFFA